MGQKVSKREQAAVEQMRRERDGTAGMVQCEGCPTGTPLVIGGEGLYDGLCERHRNQVMTSAHAAELGVYEDRF
jgi:hypothetical protein